MNPLINPDPLAKRELAPPVIPAPSEDPKPQVVMTPLDSYLYSMIGSQPSTLETAVTEVSDVPGLHRMSLSEYFEKQSYDCTRGDSCTIHQKDPKGKVLNSGKYILRWQLKDKRAIDYARNVRGWLLVNKVLFPDAPRTEFSANGGVERGDTVLMVMPSVMALKLREMPGKRSREKIQARMTPSRAKPGRMLMTSNVGSDHVYEPDMGAEESETSGAPSPGSIVVD